MSTEYENNSFNSEPNAFGLPEGYFQKSAGSILNKLEWLEEHKEFPNLQKLPRETVFQVPIGYFERQTDRLELLDMPVLASLKKQGVFSVPSGYFEELRLSELASQIREDEKERPKVISLFRARAWMAAAALLLLTLGLWLYDFYFVPVVTGDCGTVACVDKQDLLKSKTLESLESDELYDLVNSKKLEEKLNNTSTQKPTNSQKDSSHKKSTVSDEVLDEI